MKQSQLTTPYAAILPPLATPEFLALQQSIATHGFRADLHGPLIATEDGRLLDGHHRLKLCPDAPVHFLPGTAGWSDPECIAYILRHADLRRNLSPDQKTAVVAQKKQVAQQLKEQDPQRYTQQILAEMLGVGQQRISEWFITNTASGNGYTASRDARVKIHPSEHPSIVERLEAGETQQQVAADYGVSQPRIAGIAQKYQKERLRSSSAAAATPDLIRYAPVWQVFEGDCLEGLRQQVAPGSVRLAFMDPPYNIGIDYGAGAEADAIPELDYLALLETCFALIHERLTADGSLWVLINDEYAAEVGCLLKQAGFTRRNWIKWYETFGVNCQKKFNRTSRHLFYCVRDAKRFLFHRATVLRPSDRQTKYGDVRAEPEGKILDDVWTDIPRLAGTHKERLPDFPTQLPLALLRRVVLVASDPGDLVLDPFSGSGTTGAAAVEQRRCFVGFEKNPVYAVQARQRLALCADELLLLTPRSERNKDGDSSAETA